MTTKGDAPAKKAARFPISVREGDVEARIYRTPTTIRGVKYDTFTLCWHLSGSRQRRRFSDLSAARSEAERIVREKSQGALGIAALSAADRVALESALTALAKTDGSAYATPSRLVQVVQNYTTAVRVLPAGTNLVQAAEYFARRHPANIASRTVTEAVQEFIADRGSAGCSGIHLRDLSIRLGQFSRAFAMPLGAVTAPLVQQWVYGLKHAVTGRPASNRTKENMLRQICSLFSFARRMKYVPAELAFEIADIPAPKKEHTEIGIYTAEQIAAMLAKADAEIVAPLAIAAFTGLRLAELAKLDWREVRLHEGLIVVEAAKAKTAARRIVPISPNLTAWLVPYARPLGPINPSQEDDAAVGDLLGKRFQTAATRAGVRWKRNGLRHSFISYRVAALKDVPAVALESGNSPAMIFQNYRALATEAEGRAWFAVFPPRPAENVVPINVAGATA